MISKKTKIKRFEILLDMMENHKKYFPKVKFDLRDWASNNFKGDASKETSCLLDGTCGTAACAIGSAAMHKPFNRRGLTLTYDFTSDRAARGIKNQFIVRYKTLTDWPAIREFFGLNQSEDFYLFYGPEYSGDKATRRQVISRLKKFIKNDYSKV